MILRNWRVVRVQKDGTLYVADMEFWTRAGAQAAATHLNTTFGSMGALANALNGHNYWAAHKDKLEAIRRVLLIAAAERENAKKN